MLQRLHEDLNIENETYSNHLNDLQALADFSNKGLEHTINDISRMIADINACITIESHFIQGTSVLLKDVVSSYSRLSRLQACDQRIIETIKSPLLVVDAYLVAVSANQTCYDTFGLSSETLLGKPFYTARGSCFPMPDDPELKARLQAVFHEGTPLESFEITLQSYTEDIPGIHQLPLSSMPAGSRGILKYHLKYLP